MPDDAHRSEIVELLAVDPDLGASVPSVDLQRAREHARARSVRLDGPVWDPGPLQRLATPRWLGLFVVSGLLIRCVTVGPRSAGELFGPGDLLRPWDADGEYGPLPIELEWRIPNGAELAVLDDAFAMRIRRWPSISARLMGRIAARARSLALAHAVSHLNRADSRALVLFWLLAERWGAVTPEGITIALPLTHETIAMLIGVRRPTATLALNRLANEGLLVRHERHRWLLSPEAVEFLHHPKSLGLPDDAGPDGSGQDAME